MAWGITELGLTQKQKNNYSFQRALHFIANQNNPSARKEAGFEIDVSDQITKRDSRETNGIIIPQEVMENPYRSRKPMGGHILTDQVLHNRGWQHNSPQRLQKRAMEVTNDGRGGYLVDSEIQSIITVLVENTLALQNVPTYTVKGDQVSFPGQTGRVDIEFKSEVASATESNPTFHEVNFTNKRLTSLVQVSRTILLQSNEDLEAFIRNAIAIDLSKALDSAMFYGATNGPTGITNTSDIKTVTWSGTSADIYPNNLDLWSQIGYANIPTRNLKWFTSWRFCHDNKRAQKLNEHSEDRVIDRDGMIDGVPVEVSSQIVGTSSVKQEAFLADWMEAALVFWQDLEITIDPYSKAEQNLVRMVPQILCDFNVLRPDAFGRIGG